MKARFGLSALLGNAGVRRAADFDPDKRYVSHGPLERLGELRNIRELRSTDNLLASWRGAKAQAWPSGKYGNAQPMLIDDPKLLWLVFEKGYTLYFQSMEEVYPRLKGLLRKLERELGCGEGELSCDGFASKTGSGTAMHFDPAPTFNVQMTGTKVWRMACNGHVEFPHEGWIKGAKNTPEFKAYASKFPTAMPKDAKPFSTAPGTVVYIPHGSWHETRAQGPSFALLFTIRSPMLLEHLMRHLNARLLSQAGWRRRAIGVRGGAFWRLRARSNARLLEELRGVVARLTVGDLKKAARKGE